jgi:hypothetical protein
MRKYISDIVTEEEINKWQLGQRILINSQTGTGKSELIKNNLYEHCKLLNKKILLMSNRNLLKNQNIVDIGDKIDFIKAHNYQEFEASILRGEFIDELFSSYDYIVYDEAHYFFSDSQFNKNTDLLIRPIKDTPKNKIFIFITATPDALLDYQDKFDYIYTLPYDYSYIKNIYFYTRLTNKSTIVESIINNIAKDEKILYFGSNAQDNFNMYQKYDNSSFICSKGNSLNNECNQETISQIVNNSNFESHSLFSTKLLDNGVNLKDEDLKHIIIDMVDPISFIQSLGRKRCLNESDQINLYIRDYHKGNIYWIVEGFNKQVLSMQKERDSGVQINSAKYQHCMTQRKILGKIVGYGQHGYKKYICELLNFDITKIKNANEEFENGSLQSLLESYVGKKMFKDEQERFKDLFFGQIFTPKRTDYSARGIKAAKGLIEEDKLKFVIYSRQETKGINRNKNYWIIENSKEQINGI